MVVRRSVVAAMTELRECFAEFNDALKAQSVLLLVTVGLYESCSVVESEID